MYSVNKAATNVQFVDGVEVKATEKNILRLHVVGERDASKIEYAMYTKTDDNIFPATYMPNNLMATIVRTPLTSIAEQIDIYIQEPHPSVQIACNGKCTYVLPPGTIGAKFMNVPDTYGALSVVDELMLIGGVQASGEIHLGNYGDLHFHNTNAGFNLIPTFDLLPVPIPVPSGYGRMLIPKLSNIYYKI